MLLNLLHGQDGLELLLFLLLLLECCRNRHVPTYFLLGSSRGLFECWASTLPSGLHSHHPQRILRPSLVLHIVRQMLASEVLVIATTMLSPHLCGLPRKCVAVQWLGPQSCCIISQRQGCRDRSLVAGAAEAASGLQSPSCDCVRPCISRYDLT